MQRNLLTCETRERIFYLRKMNSVEKTISKFFHEQTHPQAQGRVYRKMRVVRASLAVTDTSTGRACERLVNQQIHSTCRWKASQPELTPSCPLMRLTLQDTRVSLTSTPGSRFLSHILSPQLLSALRPGPGSAALTPILSLVST